MDFDSMNEMQRRLHNAACVLSADGDEHGFARLQRDAIAEIERLRMDLENTRAEAVLAVEAQRKQWRELLRTPHRMAGGCPDEVAGDGSRDLDCPACRLMSELGA